MLAQSYITRTDRAQRILDAGLVAPWNIAAGEWRVKSESQDNVTYNVNVTTGTCPCPDHANGHYCKHLLAASKAAEIAKRSAAKSAAHRGEWLEEIDL